MRSLLLRTPPTAGRSSAQTPRKAVCVDANPSCKNAIAAAGDAHDAALLASCERRTAPKHATWRVASNAFQQVCVRRSSGRAAATFLVAGARETCSASKRSKALPESAYCGGRRTTAYVQNLVLANGTRTGTVHHHHVATGQAPSRELRVQPR